MAVAASRSLLNAAVGSHGKFAKLSFRFELLGRSFKRGFQSYPSRNWHRLVAHSMLRRQRIRAANPSRYTGGRPLSADITALTKNKTMKI